MSTEVVVYTGPEDAPGIKSRKGSDGAFPHKWRGVEICASTMATSAAPSRPKESASPNAPTSATSAWDHTRRLLALAGGKKPLGPRVIGSSHHGQQSTSRGSASPGWTLPSLLPRDGPVSLEKRTKDATARRNRGLEKTAPPSKLRAIQLCNGARKWKARCGEYAALLSKILAVAIHKNVDDKWKKEELSTEHLYHLAIQRMPRMLEPGAMAAQTHGHWS